MNQRTDEKNAATVLVVEDTVLVRMAIAAYLRECGYRVIEAATSDEALTVLQSDLNAEVVLSTAQVAGALDAFALSRLVRKIRPQTQNDKADTPKTTTEATRRQNKEGPH